jgi:hypothetical protein
LEILYDKIQDYKLNDTESYTIITVLVDKIANSANKNRAKQLIDRYLELIGPNRGCSYLIQTLINKNTKLKLDILEILNELILTHGINILSNKDLKYLAILVNENLLKNTVIGIFAEVYSSLRDNLWTILSDIPNSYKETLYNKLSEINNNNNSVNISISHNNVHSSRNVKPKLNDTVSQRTINNTTINTKQNYTSKKMSSDEKLVDLSNMDSNNSDYNTLQDKQELMGILRALNSPDNTDKVNTILIIHEMITSKFNSSKHILIPNIDHLIKAFITASRNIFENKNLEQIPFKLAKYILSVLHKIAMNKELIKDISYDVLMELSIEVLSGLVIDGLDKVGDNQEGVVIIKSFNSTMLRVLENCDHTEVISVLLEISEKYRHSTTKPKVSYLAAKCLVKINQVLDKIIDDIDIEKIFLKIHEVVISIEDTNPDLISDNPNDQFLLKYIKNLILELVRLRKDTVFQDYLRAVRNHDYEDRYIKVWIKNMIVNMSQNNNNDGEYEYQNTVASRNVGKNNILTEGAVEQQSNINNLRQTLSSKSTTPGNNIINVNVNNRNNNNLSGTAVNVIKTLNLETNGRY